MSTQFTPRLRTFDKSHKNAQHATIVAKQLIVCEGEDEFDLLTLLCNQKQIAEARVQIKIVKRDALAQKFTRLKSISGFSNIQKLACVFDAEETPDRFKAELEVALKNQGLDAITAPSDRILHPANGSGALETVVKTYLLAGTPQDLRCVDDWLACTQASNPAAYSTAAQWDKAWVQVWLAARMKSTAFSRIGFAMGSDENIANLLLPAFSDLSTWLDGFVSEKTT